MMLFVSYIQIYPQTTITVTTSANDGPGSLRAAMINANNASDDVLINFDIDSTMPIVIIVDEDLPTITKSNVTLDGSSQLGYTENNPVITIQPKDIQDETSVGLFFSETAINGAVYGLAFKYFHVCIRAWTHNLQVGAPGLGNWVEGLPEEDDDNGIAVGVNRENVSIQSNTISYCHRGIKLEGINAIVGGYENGEGNIMINNYRAIRVLAGIDSEIVGNFIGYNPLTNEAVGNFYDGIRIELAVRGTKIIGNQILACTESQIVFRNDENFGTGPSQETIIQGNSIGTTFDESVNAGGRFGIRVESTNNAIIGGNEIEQKNIIANSETGIELGVQTDSVLINRNSIYCNDTGIKYVTEQANNAKSKPSFSAINLEAFIGVSDPWDSIEIFFDKNSTCPEKSCQGKNYLTTVHADQGGIFSYFNPIQDIDYEFGDSLYLISATATGQNKNTSELSNCIEMPICSENCVMPGDYNRDGIVNHKDLLSVALAFGKTNTLGRLYHTEQFFPQDVGPDWDQQLPNGIDYKYLDGNNDLKIDRGDIDAINANYERTHSVEPIVQNLEDTTANGILPKLTLEVEGDLQTGMNELKFVLGNENEMAEDIYGIAFKLSYTFEGIDSVNIFHPDGPMAPKLVVDSSFLGSANELVVIDYFHPKYDSNRKEWDIAISRTDQKPITRFGELATGIVCIIEIGTVRPFIEFSFSDIQYMNEVGVYTPLSPKDDSYSVSVGVSDLSKNDFEIYPNPVIANQQQLNFKFPVEWSGSKSIEVFDLEGNFVIQEEMNFENTSSVNLNNLKPGAYIIRVENEGKYFSKKVLVW